MTQKREFRRITSAVEGTVECHGATFACRLENLSLGGALVSVRESAATGIRAGDRCLLRLNQETGGRRISVEARVAHHVFAFVGVAFHSVDVETRAQLMSIIEKEELNALKMCDSTVYGTSNFMQ